MIPAPILAALAPVVIDTLTGKAKEKAGGPVGDAVANLLTETIGHEKRKASVRPTIMKLTGQTSIIIAVAGVVAALSPLLGVPQETSNAMVKNLLMLFGAVGGTYAYKHTIRSVDKAKEGKAPA